jgi:protoporphyrinogen oxidase
VVQAMENISYRAMLLIYLVLEQNRFSEYDAHYFPGPNIPITRLSEPKIYSNAQTPQDSTVLCAELPCFPEDAPWRLTEEQLGSLVLDCLASVDLPVRARIKAVTVRRLPQAYPVYRLGYEKYFDLIDQWLGNMDNLITFGRQGLFVHDNTHHSLYMAYCAVNCLDDKGRFDREQWQKCRRIFATHVVED